MPPPPFPSFIKLIKVILFSPLVSFCCTQLKLDCPDHLHSYIYTHIKCNTNNNYSQMPFSLQALCGFYIKSCLDIDWALTRVNAENESEQVPMFKGWISSTHWRASSASRCKPIHSTSKIQAAWQDHKRPAGVLVNYISNCFHPSHHCHSQMDIYQKGVTINHCLDLIT